MEIKMMKTVEQTDPNVQYWQKKATEEHKNAVDNLRVVSESANEIADLRKELKEAKDIAEKYMHKSVELTCKLKRLLDACAEFVIFVSRIWPVRINIDPGEQDKFIGVNLQLFEKLENTVNELNEAFHE
jgi:hypothetical protein